ncbi:hypothetical protein [Pseudonocardia sp. KRD291]|nr:hypothetical protein [Pseudonocardia sp. KRD291]
MAKKSHPGDGINGKGDKGFAPGRGRTPLRTLTAFVRALLGGVR